MLAEFDFADKTWGELAWVGLGLFGQLLFSARMLVQWLASEKARQSVVPVAFWYMSLFGSIILLTYAIYIQDLVFTLGQAFGFVVYIRNLYLIKVSSKPD